MAVMCMCVCALAFGLDRNAIVAALALESTAGHLVSQLLLAFVRICNVRMLELWSAPVLQSQVKIEGELIRSTTLSSQQSADGLSMPMLATPPQVWKQHRVYCFAKGWTPIASHHQAHVLFVPSSRSVGCAAWPCPN